MKRLQIGAALVLVALAAGTWASGALSAGGGATAKTKVRMKMHCDDGTCEKARALTSGSFTGRVRSGAAECVDGRTVKVIRKGVSPGPIDSVEAAANGKWTIESDDLLPGTYFAKTPKTTEGGTKCKPAKSKKWTLVFERRAPRAHKEEFESTITIKRTPSFVYHGKVLSDSDDCVKNRRVTLIAKESGSDAEFVVGHDRTDEKGRWSYQVIGNGYYATVKQKVVKRGDHEHTCLFDRSPTMPPRR
jgi:hypothetical protein